MISSCCNEITSGQRLWQTCCACPDDKSREIGGELHVLRGKKRKESKIRKAGGEKVSKQEEKRHDGGREVAANGMEALWSLPVEGKHPCGETEQYRHPNKCRKFQESSAHARYSIA